MNMHAINTISTVCTCESHCFSVCFEALVVCDSRANQALAQSRPIDALHLVA